VAVEEVVPQHQGGWMAGEEVGTDHKGLGQAIGAGLDRGGDLRAPGGAIAEEPLEGGLVDGGGDDQHLADARQHQGAKGVVDHRLVVHWYQLLADGGGEGSQPGAATSGQDDASPGGVGAHRQR
jgi:hypothetical protein